MQLHCSMPEVVKRHYGVNRVDSTLRPVLNKTWQVTHIYIKQSQTGSNFINRVNGRFLRMNMISRQENSQLSATVCTFIAQYELSIANITLALVFSFTQLLCTQIHNKCRKHLTYPIFRKVDPQ